MQYRITYEIDEDMPNYGKAKGMIHRNERATQITTSREVFLEMASDIVDPPSGDLSDEDIMKSFGFEGISKENIEQIRKYYLFRKDVYDQIVRMKPGEQKAFRIPLELDRFTIREIPDDLAEKEKVNMHYIHVVIIEDGMSDGMSDEG